MPFCDFPLGLQRTASCWAFGSSVAVLPLLNVTRRSPLGSTIGADPWSKSQSFGLRVRSNALPKLQYCDDRPLISSGVDHVSPWLVDIEP